VIYCDGACEPKNPGGVATAGWGIFPDQPNPEDSFSHLHSTFVPIAQEAQVVRDGRGNNDPKATNNFAEYCALGRALRFLKDQGWKGGSIQVYTDSKLLTNQISTKWRCNKEHLKELRARIWELLEQLELINVNREIWGSIDDTGIDDELGPGKFQIKWIPRDQNEFADELSKRAYTEYVGSNPPVKTTKKKPPKKKFKPGEERFHCTLCGHKGQIKELRVDEGELACPICQTPAIEFD
jgi:ribonuclease HI